MSHIHRLQYVGSTLGLTLDAVNQYGTHIKFQSLPQPCSKTQNEARHLAQRITHKATLEAHA